MKFWISVVVGALGLAGLFYWLTNRQQAQDAAVQKLQAPLPTTVAVTTARAETMAPATEYLGQTQARREVQLVAPASGLVRGVAVALNSRVAAGQPLVRFDAAQLQQTLAAARQGLQKARLDEQRQRQLLAENNTTQNEVENAGLQTRNAAVQVTALTTQLRDAAVRAPFAGTVSEKLVEPGMYMQPGALLLTLTDVGAVKLVVQVPEAELREWRAGRRLPVRFEAYPDLEFAGTVHSIGLKGGEGGRFPVELRVENNRAAAPLRVGLTARVRLTAAPTTQLLVPRAALASGAAGAEGVGQAAVFVLENHSVRRRAVVTGKSYGSCVAVRRGLQAGEQVVVSGTQALHDGQTVRVAADTAGVAAKLTTRN